MEWQHAHGPMADHYVLDALKGSKTRLYSPADIATDALMLESCVNQSLSRLTPEQVRKSAIQNRRGANLYAPADRAPSTREQRVSSPNKFKRGLARFWYLGVWGIRSCDL